MPSTIPWWANSMLTTLLAIVVAWVVIAFDRRKTVNQELIRKRIQVYDEMAPMLNDIVCFFLYVGDFKSLPPATLIAHERNLDRKMHLYRPIFSTALESRYDAFMMSCFAVYAGGIGKPALIKADYVRVARVWGKDWKPEWNGDFVPPDAASKRGEVGRRYDALMDQFARELGARARG